jgi:hypothetical protein
MMYFRLAYELITLPLHDCAAVNVSKKSFSKRKKTNTKCPDLPMEGRLIDRNLYSHVEFSCNQTMFVFDI